MVNLRISFATALVSLLFSASTQYAQSTSQTKAIVIRNATIIDGSGRRARSNQSLVIKDGIIQSVGPAAVVKTPAGARVIDGRGLVLAPGFIDAHNHSDRGFDDDPSATTQVSQGITTVAVGQDGGSEFPIGEFLRKLDSSPVAVNVLTFVGHATLRERVMHENTNRPATTAEVEQMKALLEKGMRDGAFGLSSGLEYETGKPATTEELIALARVAARFKGLYISHIRDEADEAFSAFAEAIRIGREGGLPVQISHIKLGTVAVWGRAAEAVALIDRARLRGQDVTADCYPYDAWSSTIRVLIPSGRHDNPKDVGSGLAAVGGAGNITIVGCEAHRDYEFQTLEEIARRENISPTEMYMKIVRDGGASVVCHSMKDADIRTFYRQPWVMVSSDGGINSRHPRGAGSYPRVLGRFVRELRWLSLTEAIRKMTSLPASRFRLSDRGLVRPGFKADIVLLDSQRVIDRATFQQPGLLSEGISRVFVNGIEVWSEGKVTGNRPGQALRHE